MDRVHDPGNDGSITLTRILLQQLGNTDWQLSGPEFKQLKKDIVRLKWNDDLTIDLATSKHPFLGLDRAEILVALAGKWMITLHGRTI